MKKRNIEEIFEQLWDELNAIGLKDMNKTEHPAMTATVIYMIKQAIDFYWSYSPK